jgi:hypothetical protein
VEALKKAGMDAFKEKQPDGKYTYYALPKGAKPKAKPAKKRRDSFWD